MPSPPQVPCFDKMLSTATVNVFLAVRRGDFVVLYCSPSISRVVGLETSSVVGKSILELANARAEDREGLRTLLVNAASRVCGPQTLGSFRRRKESGETMRIEIGLSSDGEFVYALLRDTVTEHCTEERLEAFLLSTSHDLRTPCHTIGCAAVLLSNRDSVLANAEAGELLRAVRASSTVMEDTTANVLLLRNGLKKAQCNLTARDVVDVRATYADALEVASLVFNPSDAPAAKQVAYDEKLPLQLLGDMEAVRRLLSNLIVSACLLMQSGGKAARIESTKFTRAQEERAGGLEAAPAEDSRVGVDVSLNLQRLEGLPDVLETIFDPYSGVCCTSMCSARALARAMGGDVEATDGDCKMHINAQFWLHCVGSELVCPEEAAELAAAAAAAAVELAGEEEVSKPTPPMAELTKRMMECMTETSDHVFNQSDFLEDGTPVFSWVSPGMKRHLGWDDVVGKSPCAFLHPDDIKTFGAGLQEARERQAATGDPEQTVAFCYPRRQLLPSGEYASMLTSGAIDAHSFYLCCRDISGQGRRERALRSLLLSTSRELREPANTVLVASSMLQVLPAVKDDQEASFLVRAIASSCGVLVGLITNVFSLKSIEAGKLHISPSAFDPAEALRCVVDACRFGRTVAISVEAERLPHSVVADRGFLVHIFQNLLSNAMRYEAGKGVTVGCRYVAGEGGNGRLVGSVTDRGCGMDAESCTRMFDLYAAWPSGGSGLGLFISRACAQRAGGKLTVQTSPGEGATFTFTFPVTAVEEESESPPTPTLVAKRDRTLEDEIAAADAVAAEVSAMSTNGDKKPKLHAAEAAPSMLRCLLADDHDLNLRLVSRMLSGCGLSVSTARDGLEAYEMLLASYAEGRPPHVVVLDMQMPRWGGLDCARAFRAWEREQSPERRVPIICFTANVLDLHREESAAAGCDGFITKPLTPSALADVRARAEAMALTDKECGGPQ